MTNQQIVFNFTVGNTQGKSNSMEIKNFGADGVTHTQLIGYGWAVYAENKEGELTVYEGWQGYSRTTSKHLSLLRQFADGAVKKTARKTAQDRL